MAFFPMFFELEGKRVLVVGAGRVGSRRIEALLRFDALVTVVSLSPSAEILKLAEDGSITLIQADYRVMRESSGAEMMRQAAGGLSPFFMVLAATGDLTVDELVRADACVMNAFVNVAGDRTKSGFYFPGIAKDGAVTAGVIADGMDHGLAKRATKQIEIFLRETFNRKNFNHRDGSGQT